MIISRLKWWAMSLFILYVAFSSAAYAISVQSQLFPLGGNQYRYVYTVTNDDSLGAGVAVKLFDIEQA